MKISPLLTEVPWVYSLVGVRCGRGSFRRRLRYVKKFLSQAVKTFEPIGARMRVFKAGYNCRGSIPFGEDKGGK